MVPPINMWEKGKMNKEKERERENERKAGRPLFFFHFSRSRTFQEIWKVMSFDLIFILSLGLEFNYKRYKDLGPIFKPN